MSWVKRLYNTLNKIIRSGEKLIKIYQMNLIRDLTDIFVLWGRGGPEEGWPYKTSCHIS